MLLVKMPITSSPTRSSTGTSRSGSQSTGLRAAGDRSSASLARHRGRDLDAVRDLQQRSLLRLNNRLAQQIRTLFELLAHLLEGDVERGIPRRVMVRIIVRAPCRMLDAP